MTEAEIQARESFLSEAYYDISERAIARNAYDNGFAANKVNQELLEALETYHKIVEALLYQVQKGKAKGWVESTIENSYDKAESAISKAKQSA